MPLNSLIADPRIKWALPVAFVLISLASIAWQASLDLKLAHSEPNLAASAASPAKKPTPTHKPVILSDLFGDAKKQPIPRTTSLPQTRLQLSIRGLFANADGSGQALISANSKSAKLYRVGDELPGNAVLESISAEHVVLKRAGRFEQLRILPQQSRPSDNKTASNTTNSNRRASTASSSASQPVSNNLTLTERLKRLRAQK